MKGYTKEFKNLSCAMEFAAENNGSVEGPFPTDDGLWYVVFYRGKQFMLHFIKDAYRESLVKEETFYVFAEDLESAIEVFHEHYPGVEVTGWDVKCS